MLPVEEETSEPLTLVAEFPVEAVSVVVVVTSVVRENDTVEDSPIDTNADDKTLIAFVVDAAKGDDVSGLTSVQGVSAHDNTVSAFVVAVVLVVLGELSCWAAAGEHLLEGEHWYSVCVEVTVTALPVNTGRLSVVVVVVMGSGRTC